MVIEAHNLRLCCVSSILIGAMMLVRGMPCWTAPPPEPNGTYKFHATRAMLHLSLVPEPRPAEYGIPGPGLPSAVRPLCLFGWTVGGSFYVDWDESPFGQYCEVGLLSALVTLATGFSFGAWGAWASHVWVDNDDAAEGGRRMFGLPTSGCELDYQTAGPDGTVLAFGKAPFTSIGGGVGPLGRIDTPPKITVGNLPLQAGDFSSAASEITLPNLSGCLSRKSDPDDVAEGFDCTALLQYPICLKPKSMRMLPGSRPDGGAGVVPRLDFSEWIPLFAIELRDIDIDVGKPQKC